jgi:hypothetical protein
VNGRPTVAFATSTELPDSSPDDRLALTELAARSVHASPAVWDSETVDWSAFDIVVVRSTWDYTRKADRFLGWVDRVSRVASLWNPPNLIRWNSHKSYLVELARAGFHVVPTELLARGSDRPLADILKDRGWAKVVVKPAIGAAARELLVVPPEELEAGEHHLHRLLAKGEVLVQPFLEGVEKEGERSLIYFAGRFHHAIDYAYVLGDHSRQPRKSVPRPQELAQAEGILRWLPTKPLYARVDFLPGGDGKSLLGELELIEPDLFLRADARAPASFAESILGALDGAPGARVPGP